MKYLLILCLAAALYGCNSSKEKETETAYKPDPKDSTSFLPKGSYDFTIYDSTGARLSEGKMTVDVIGSKTYNGTMRDISGTISITKDYDKFPGRETISKEYAGFIYLDKKTLNMNLNPRIADANVYVNAKSTSGKLDGTWYYSTFRGSQVKGKFKAVYKGK